MGLGVLNIARNDNGENLYKQNTKNARYKSIVGNMEDKVDNKLLADESKIDDGLGNVNSVNVSIVDRIKNKEVIDKVNAGLGSLGGWWNT